MGTIHVSAERTVDAPAETVYGYIADMREHHPRFLPPAFSDFDVESGGVGAGTITRFKVSAGRRSREYRMRVAEPEPGRVLTESDTSPSLATTFTVTPQIMRDHHDRRTEPFGKSATNALSGSPVRSRLTRRWVAERAIDPS
jgi:uncharacterized protein YndB with AHSA1/START domain